MREYDAVVIGAGHNGLTAAAYLQRAGQSTVVLDADEVVGGLARTEHLDGGFRHHPHANALYYADVMPMPADLDLASHGLRTVVPVVQHGMAFADGRPGIVLHRGDHLEHTRTSIARYSRSDADLFVELRRRACALTPTLARILYRPPDDDTLSVHLAAIDKAYGSLGICSNLGSGTARTLVDGLFTSPELRTLLYLLSAELGTEPESAGSDVPFLGFLLWALGRRALPVGGMGAVTRSLAAALTAAGGHLVLGAEVRHIDVRDGRAVAVRLADGRTMRARKAVVSSAAFRHTLLDLVAPTALPPDDHRDAHRYERRPASTIASQHFGLHAPPTYRSARAEPDLDACAHTYIGLDSPDEVLQQFRDLERGLLPAPGGSVHLNTLVDPSQAPQGRTGVGVTTQFPSLHLLDSDERKSIQVSYNAALLRRWADYAPNMTRHNVITDHFTPLTRHDRHIALRHGADQYRSGVAGLYLCGASTYPGGGVHGGGEYNAAGVITADLGLL